MSLATGTRIGPYEIVAAIGAGGMGEVYRARDSRLNRDVALKVLPTLFTSDPERLARFRREAQVLASLNHPHIAAIYGFEDASPATGPGQSGAHALVMEYVPGEDLSQRIKQGALSLPDALAIARQIADALETAHEQGIVHRDLKPANIKVRDDGTVKVLDFGLAKALAPEANATGDAMNSPTLTARGTEMGTILGTAAYMSPEQAKGKPADRRADIWAFGVVLFEMLTGQQLFGGESSTEVMASVMKEAPDWNRLPPNLPPAIVRLLHRSLEKDPRKRLSAIGDARFDLDDVTGVDTRPAASVQPAPRWHVRELTYVALGGLAVGALAAWSLFNVFRPTPKLAVVRASILPASSTTLYSDAASVVISPDGRMVAFVTGDPVGNDTHLWLRPVSALAAKRVEGADDALQPFWSPDSQQVAFFTKDKLKRVPVAGGRVEEICDVQDSRGGTWGAHDVIVFAPANAGGLMKVAAAGGTPVPVTQLDAGHGETGHRFPSFLPDGDHFLYSALPAHAGAFDVLIGSLAGGKGEPLMKSEGTPVYAAPGYLLFDRKGGLVAQRFDPERRSLSGELLSLEDLPGQVGSSWLASRPVSVSDTGTIAYLQAPPANTSLVWFDPTGREIGKVAVPPAQYEMLAISPDGRRAVAERRVSPTLADLWMIDLERGGASRFTNDDGVDYFPLWSPDGQYIAYASSREGPEQIAVKPSSGSGKDEVWFHSTALFNQPQSWSDITKAIVFNQLNPRTNNDLWILPATPGETHKPVPYLATPANEMSGRISYDGRWMAYTSDKTGRYEAFVQSFPTPGHEFRVTTGGASAMWWREDSKQLFIINSDLTQVLTADVLPGPEFSTAPAKVVGHLPKGILFTDVTKDLRRILALAIEGGNVNMSVTLVQNWTAALARER